MYIWQKEFLTYCYFQFLKLIIREKILYFHIYEELWKNSVSIFINTIIHSSVWIQTTLSVWTWYLRVLKYSYKFLWWFSLVKSLEFRLLVFEYLILLNINCVINTNTTLLIRTYYYLAWLEIRSRMKLKFFQIHMSWLERNNGCYTSWT